MKIHNKFYVCLLNVCLLIWPVINYGQSPAGENIRLKVLSYNLRFGELASLEELAEFIKETDPDIVALQEVDVRTNRDRAPHQNGKDFITELGYRTGLLSAYARTIDYSGGYYGIGILSKFPFEHTRKALLPKPEGGHEQRAMLLANVELPEGRKITFISTHLDHSSSEVRSVQIQTINKIVNELQHPVIIAGDFNARPDSPEIEEGMKTFLQVCSDDYTIPSTHPRSKIDYIFCKPADRRLKVESNTPVVTLSDHLPIISTIELR